MIVVTDLLKGFSVWAWGTGAFDALWYGKKGVKGGKKMKSGIKAGCLFIFFECCGRR